MYAFRPTKLAGNFHMTNGADKTKLASPSVNSIFPPIW